MKTQYSPWKLQATACLLALLLAGGCANKNVSESEQMDGYSEYSEDVGGDFAGGGELGDLDATEAELFGDDGSIEDPSFAGAPANSGTELANANDPAMESLFEPQEFSDEPNFDELTGAPEAPPSGGMPGGNQQPSLAETMSGAEVTEPENVAASSLPVDSGSSSDNWQPSVGNDAGLSDPAGSSFSDTPSYTPPKPVYRGAVLPNIPGRALKRSGTSVNRYYFLRSGDKPASVAELIYGDRSRSKQLKKWNKGRWIPGKVIYYSSPIQPDDAQMLSLYDERSLSADSYTVARGETMSGIAKQKLGSLSSWKELAVVNGLSSPDTLRRGQVIKIYSDLGTASTFAAPQNQALVADNAMRVEPPVQATAPPAAALDTQTPAAAETAPPPAYDPPPSAAGNGMADISKTKSKPGKQKLDVAKLVTQNAFAVAMGLGITLLLASLWVINRRKRAGGAAVDEFGEEAFAAPARKKRR